MSQSMIEPQVTVPQDGGRVGQWHLAGNELHLTLPDESNGTASQWFYLRLSGLPELERLRVIIRNAGDSFYPRGWAGYRPFVSRLDTQWERTEPIVMHEDGSGDFCIIKPSTDLMLAWYEPYSVVRMHTWINNIGKNPLLKIEQPLPDFHCIEVGDARLPIILIIARQHPGEVMASFFMEGFVAALLGLQESGALEPLLSRFSLLLLPMMNPLGVRQGRHRIDVHGRDYNRSWNLLVPPAEIDFVKTTVVDTRELHAFFDVHGDEVRKSAPNYIDPEPLRREAAMLRDELMELVCKETHDVEVKTELSYPRLLLRRLRTGEFNLRGRRAGTASAYMGIRYGIPSFTYEIKAHDNSPADCRNLGAGLARALVRYASR